MQNTSIRQIDTYKGFVANNPRIMTWGDKSDVTRTELRLGTVVHSDHYPAGNHIDEVRNRTTLCPHGRLNAFRPAPTRLICDADNLNVTQVNNLNFTFIKVPNLFGSIKALLNHR